MWEDTGWPGGLGRVLNVSPHVWLLPKFMGQRGNSGCSGRVTQVSRALSEMEPTQGL